LSEKCGLPRHQVGTRTCKKRGIVKKGGGGLKLGALPLGRKKILLQQGSEKKSCCYPHPTGRNHPIASKKIALPEILHLGEKKNRGGKGPIPYRILFTVGLPFTAPPQGEIHHSNRRNRKGRSSASRTYTPATLKKERS